MNVRWYECVIRARVKPSLKSVLQSLKREDMVEGSRSEKPIPEEFEFFQLHWRDHLVQMEFSSFVVFVYDGLYLVTDQKRTETDSCFREEDRRTISQNSH